MPPALPVLLTAQEVADAARVSRSTVYRWADEGVLQAVVIGSAVRFKREEVEALLSGERAG